MGWKHFFCKRWDVMNSMTTTCSIQHNTYSINNNSQNIYKKCTVITDNNNMIWNKSLKKTVQVLIEFKPLWQNKLLVCSLGRTWFNSLFHTSCMSLWKRLSCTWITYTVGLLFCYIFRIPLCCFFPSHLILIAQSLDYT